MILGNWKSNGNHKSLQAFISAFGDFPCADVKVGIAVPEILLGTNFDNLWKGSQDVSQYGPGAFTGETHTGLLLDQGVNFCLIGHSERRKLLGESIQQTAEKLGQVQKTSLTAVFCVGESLEEREAGNLAQVLASQLSAIQQESNLVIAYEPVWAIGTGKAATPADAAQAHQIIANHFKEKGMSCPKILYGGSVKSGNAQELAKVANIDGFLVGGASLTMEQFGPIIKAFVGAKSA